MGCYDTIFFKCPECGADMDAQSKSGDCLLNSFERHSVPVSVAYDSNRHAPFTCDCGKSYQFDYILPDEPEPKIWLSLKEINTGKIIK